MTTALRIGPADHGRPLTFEEFAKADWAEGYQYELVDGKLYVAPLANQPENRVELWILFGLHHYASEHPDVINHVTPKARVFVPGRTGVTVPEPDVAAYRDYPLERPIADVRWQDVSPLLVVEVLGDDPQKDLVRNVELYLQVPSIREYWVFDTRREGAGRPHLIAHRRWGSRWRVVEVAPGATYTTRLLPGFTLVVDPRR
jgi:Uma2 family endonuclease